MSLSDFAYIRRFFSVYSQEEKDKVRGHAFYPSDYMTALLQEGVAHVYVIRSPYAGASFQNIRSGEAEKIPGVLKVISAKDIPNNIPIAGEKSKGAQLILPESHVRFRGEPVALVVADSLSKAKEAAKLVEIDWKVDEESPREVIETLHYEKGHRSHENLKTVETEFCFPSLHARYLEPESGWVNLDGNNLCFHIGSLLSEAQRVWLSQVLNLPVFSITAQEAYLGGQFGGRQQREMIAFLALASWLCKRSCCLYLEYQNQDVGSYGYAGKLQISYDPKDGRMKYLGGEVSVDAGSYGRNTSSVLKLILEHAACVYDFQYISLKGEAVSSPTHPRRALKGEGLTAITWVTEQLVDRIAKEMDIPALDFRSLHLRPDAESIRKVYEETERVEKPFRLLTSERYLSAWDAKPILGRGFSFQIYQSSKANVINSIEVSIELSVSGSFVIRTSNHTLDLHMKNALCDVAAAVLKTHPKAFTVEGQMRLEFEKPRRRETYPEFYYLAQATWHAADELQTKIRGAGQELLRTSGVDLKDGAVIDKEKNKKMGYRELAFTYGVHVLKASYVLENFDRPHGCAASAISRVSFHPLTGELSVDSVKVIIDAGPVVRRTGLEIEAESAVSWALAALFSSSVERDQPIPTALDGPDEVNMIPIEYPLQSYADQAPDYFGSRGVSDVLMAVVLSSLVTAIQDAKSQTLREIPMANELMYPEQRVKRANMIPFRR